MFLEVYKLQNIKTVITHDLRSHHLLNLIKQLLVNQDLIIRFQLVWFFIHFILDLTIQTI